MPGPPSMNTVDRLVELLGDDLDHGGPDTSFSPFWSNVGLGFAAGYAEDGTPGLASGVGFAGGPAAAARGAPQDRPRPPGIATLYLHLNRVTRALGAPFLAVPGRLVADARGALAVEQDLGGGRLRVAFGGVDTFLVEATRVDHARLAFLDDPALRLAGIERLGADRRYRASVPTLDARDPDTVLPVTIGARLLHGAWDDEVAPGRLRAAPDGGWRLLLTVALLDVDDALVDARLDDSAVTLDEALGRSRAWLAEALGDWRLPEREQEAAKLAATAAYALLSNTCAAPGLLAGPARSPDHRVGATTGARGRRLASYPSRGGYPVHFLWDACFHALGLSGMAPQLATDALEVITDNVRPDGKLPHFVAATWVRPGASQPPLVGWALERLVDERRDMDLARRVLPALVANHRWWQANRGTRFGLLRCDDPFESGWDDTPRLDGGPILALDMNAYLLRSLRATARLAKRLGQGALAADQADRAARLDAALLRHLYDPERNLFLDADAETGVRRPLLTPAAFLPLWAETSLPRQRARAMVRATLLDPERLFGPVPFPSVAYDESTFRPDGWWRGPAWPPIMLLMIELLQGLDFAAEAAEAEERLYRMLVRDGELHELFESRTGVGLGQRHQGWTAAAFLWLAARRAEREERAS